MKTPTPENEPGRASEAIRTPFGSRVTWSSSVGSWSAVSFPQSVWDSYVMNLTLCASMDVDSFFVSRNRDVEGRSLFVSDPGPTRRGARDTIDRNILNDLFGDPEAADLINRRKLLQCRCQKL
jgi:hypothetical protein